MGKKGDATKEIIRTGAYDLFSKNGYTRVSMQDICNKCNLSKGGLYRHYENKEHLFVEILKELQREEEENENLQFEEEVSATEILNSFFDHVCLDLDLSKPNINIALYEFCVEHKNGIGNEILTTQFEKGKYMLSKLISYGISRNEFTVVDREGAVDSILILIEGLKMLNEVMPLSKKMLNRVLNQIGLILGVDLYGG